jgi:hypothetical protein
MKEIKLTQGKFTQVDDDDYEYLNKFKWCAAFDGTNWYAMKANNTKEKNSSITLHRFLLGVIKGLGIDHIDGNGLNNQRWNLRRCTHRQNSRNTATKKLCKSRYNGVTVTAYNNFMSRIGVDYKRIHLGTFKSENEAAIAYNNAAIKYFGEFARLNVIT